MRAGVIINANSGTVQSLQPDEALRKVAELLHRKGWESECCLLGSGNLEQQIDGLIGNGAEVIIVGGGDGTINSVAEIASRKNFVIAALPLGTHNHFAKDLGMPVKLEEAVLALTISEVRLVDLGEVNGRIFLNNSSIGAYPRAVEARSKLQKRVPLKKWAAMLIATFDTFARRPVLHVRIKLPDRMIIRSTPFVFVGNNEYEIDLFSIKLRSSLNSGKLCIYTASCSGVRGLLKLLFLSLFNRLQSSRDFETFLSEEVELLPHKKSLKVSRDGEVMRMQAPLKYRIIKGGLKVLAPKMNEQKTNE